MVRPVGSLKNVLCVSLLCGFRSAGGGTWGDVVLSQQLTQSNCQMPILRTKAGALYMAHPELYNHGGELPSAATRQVDLGAE